jgi:hypothetical protein
MFLAGSETDALLDAAIKGQSLTDRGVWIALLALLVLLLIWFAKAQVRKETQLTEKLAKVSQESTEAIQEHTLAVQALKMSLDVLTDEIRQIDRRQETERTRRPRGS